MSDAHRGHPIHMVGAHWVYSDDGTPVSNTRTECANCGLDQTPEGHDGCLGTLPRAIVMNACCGHGKTDEAYVQFYDSTRLGGQDAINFCAKLRRDDE